MSNRTGSVFVAAAALGALLLAAPTFAAGAAGEATLDVLVDTIQANRKAFVAVNLRLDDAQAEAFWPVYERYQAELTAVAQRVADVIEEYTEQFGTLDDARAKGLIERYVAAERDRAELRQKYLPQFSQVLPGRTLARLYQIENKMDAVVRFELAREIPVVEQ